MSRAFVAFILGVTALCVLLILSRTEPERNVCASVSPLQLPDISADSMPRLWVDAVSHPGLMQTHGDPEIRYRYFEPGNTSIEAIHFDGATHPVTAHSFKSFCEIMETSPENQCRFFEDDRAFGIIKYSREHVVELGMDTISTELRKVQADGAQVEIFVLSKDTHDIEATECDMSRAIWILGMQDTEGNTK